MIRCLLTAVLVQAATPPPTPRRWIVEQTNANATDKGPGDAETPFRTISAAAAVAQAGDDVVVVSSGVIYIIAAPFAALDCHHVNLSNDSCSVSC